MAAIAVLTAQPLWAADAKPSLAKPPAAVGKATKAKERKNLLQTIDAQPELQNFYHLIFAAGVDKALANSGNAYTVFAPDEAAFARFGKNELAELLKPKNKTKLRDMVLLHVAPGRIPLADFAGKQLNQSTLGGGTLVLNGRNPERLLANNAVIEPIAIPADNGVIYRIDTLLIPEAGTH